VKELPPSARLDQEQLGRASKSTRSSQRVERGAKTSSFQAIEKLADALGVQYYELFLRTPVSRIRLRRRVNALLGVRALDPRKIEEFLQPFGRRLRKLEKRVLRHKQPSCPSLAGCNAQTCLNTAYGSSRRISALQHKPK